MEVIADCPHEEGRRNERQQHNYPGMSLCSSTAKEEETREHNRETEEGMNVEQRHGCVDCYLEPERQNTGTGLFSVVTRKNLRPPVIQEQKPRRNSVRQAALSKQHRQ